MPKDLTGDITDNPNSNSKPQDSLEDRFQVRYWEVFNEKYCIWDNSDQFYQYQQFATYKEVLEERISELERAVSELPVVAQEIAAELGFDAFDANELENINQSLTHQLESTRSSIKFFNMNYGDNPKDADWETVYSEEYRRLKPTIRHVVIRFSIGVAFWLIIAVMISQSSILIAVIVFVILVVLQIIYEIIRAMGVEEASREMPAELKKMAHRDGWYD